MAQVAAYARSYTPEWRYEGAEDDPGSALAELFGDLFYQTVDRMNSVPGKLHTEFLNLTGFQMPDPVPAAGLLQFTAHDTVEEPVPVPEGTQVFTPDEEGENVVYETVRSIQSTPARLTGLFYVDARAEVIQRLDLDRPQPFFTPAQGENLQHHRFTVSQSDVLSLSGPFQVEAELRLEGGLPGAETAQRLSDPALARWTFHSGGAEVPFSRVRAKGDTVVLDYDGTEALEADGEGNFSISCWGQLGAGALGLDGVGLRSRPAGRVSVDSASNGDIPLDLEAGLELRQLDDTVLLRLDSMVSLLPLQLSDGGASWHYSSQAEMFYQCDWYASFQDPSGEEAKAINGAFHVYRNGKRVFTGQETEEWYVLEADGERVELTRNEFRILQMLLERKGQTVSREALMTRLWESDSFVDENTLSVNVGRLRRKLETAGLPDLIRTRKGEGYLVEE